MSAVLPSSNTTDPAIAFPTMADLQHQLGGNPPNCILMRPPPGCATVDDLLEAIDRRGRICELIDGVLVEKATGYYESRIAVVLLALTDAYANRHDLGIVLGSGGIVHVLPEQIRAADAAFLSWDHFPDRKLPRERVPRLVPDLAVEVLSHGNTEAETGKLSLRRPLRPQFSPRAKPPEPRCRQWPTPAPNVFADTIRPKGARPRRGRWANGPIA